MAKKAGAKPRDIPDAIRLVGEQALPLQVGTVAVTREGRLVPHDHDVPLCFGFVYAGVPFAAEVTAGPTPLVRLTADLGALPYTIECAAARRWILRLIAASGAGKRGRLELTPAKEIRFRAEAVPPAPRTPVSVMATVAALLLEWKPCLALLGELLAANPFLRRPAAPPAAPGAEA
ncbi:MAG: hypothetical protein OEU09_01890 [Rhodospirillales bacterium]|nr:hypothetical protein [Rhodospirillales bacterium]MDH3791391.1 hypothetical protein [Rhodospirillales bacterium]MDH3910017.1 hypothetical protein [Rhodospirillales bacterium]MDH3916591.1 hypothetical protein [Rhodospirillales bacterium]MDH3967440.1 hypothetical protein [Rhodospirillales bacterium]